MTFDKKGLIKRGVSLIAIAAMVLFALSALGVTGADSLLQEEASPVLNPDVVVVAIDEDTIDNGLAAIEDVSFNSPFCGGGDPAVCVNDHLANPGVRDLLPLGSLVGLSLALPRKN